MKQGTIYQFDNRVQLDTLITKYGRNHFKYIPTSSDSNYGYLYDHECKNSAEWTSATPKEVKDKHHTYGNFNVMTFEQAMGYMNSPMDFLGKMVIYDKCLTYKVTGITTYKNLPAKDRSFSVISYSDENKDKDDFFILLTEGGGRLPYDECKLFVEVVEVTVELNENYKAIVTKDNITVGCQVFPISILKDLEIALKSLDN